MGFAYDKIHDKLENKIVDKYSEKEKMRVIDVKGQKDADTWRGKVDPKLMDSQAEEKKEE